MKLFHIYKLTPSHSSSFLFFAKTSRVYHCASKPPTPWLDRDPLRRAYYTLYVHPSIHHQDRQHHHHPSLLSSISTVTTPLHQPWGRRMIRNHGGRSRWRKWETSEYRRILIREKRRLRRGFCFTRGGFMRFMRSEGKMALVQRWTRWNWSERKGLLFSPQLLIALGKIIRWFHFLLYLLLFYKVGWICQTVV